jgi:hypothetical protein
MATAGGPNIERDGLVFGYDTSYGINTNNISSRFYPGKSTTNRASEFTDPSFQSLANGVNPSTAIQLGSGHTCEIVTFQGEKALKVNRGSSNGAFSQNRIFWTRSANAGNYWSWSALVYSTTPGPSIGLEANGGGYTWGIGQVGSSSHSGNGWERLFVRSSSPLIGNTTTYNFIYANTNADFYVKDIQFEYNQYPTPFTTGTRTSTTSLIDLTRTTNINVSSVSFDSTGQPTFDGTNDYINVLSNSSLNLTSTGTVSVWINPNSLTQGSYANLVGRNTGGSVNQQSYTLSWRQVSNGIFGQICNGNGTYNELTTSFPTQSGVWYNVVLTWDGSNVKLFLNGEQANSITQTINCQVLNTDLTIGGFTYKGAGGNAEYFNGKIANVQMYNIGLSAQEVQQNYNAYKNRFNL